MFHAILIDKQFSDRTFPEQFSCFAKKQSGNWKIFGVEIEEQNIEEFIKQVQKHMNEGGWYAHAYNDKNLLVIFKHKVIKVLPHKSTWQPIIDYGEYLGIPSEQLDFWPNRFQDEPHYFT